MRVTTKFARSLFVTQIFLPFGLVFASSRLFLGHAVQLVLAAFSIQYSVIASTSCGALDTVRVTTVINVVIATVCTAHGSEISVEGSQRSDGGDGITRLHPPAIIIQYSVMFERGNGVIHRGQKPASRG